MHFFAKHERSWETVARTGFWTSLLSYAGFWILEALRPGFVARYVSVHVFLLVAIGFGAWWLWFDPDVHERSVLNGVVAFGLSVGLAVVTWRAGEGLEMYRILMTVASFLAPIAIFSLLKSN